MASGRTVLLVLLLIFLYLTPDNQQQQQQHWERHGTHKDRTQQQQRLLRLLLHEARSSRYGDFDPAAGKWLSKITGFSVSDQYSAAGHGDGDGDGDGTAGFAAWSALHSVKAAARQHLEKAVGARIVARLDTEHSAGGAVEDGASGATGTAIATSLFGESGKVGNDKEEVEEEKEIGLSPAPFCRNLTTVVSGKWVRADVVDGALSAPRLGRNTNNSSSAAGGKEQAKGGSCVEGRYIKNVTAYHGVVKLRLDDGGGEDEHIRELSAVLDIREEGHSGSSSSSSRGSSGNEWTAKLQGVHYLDYGAAILTTMSDKFLGLYALPHLAVTRRMFELAQRLLNQSLAAAAAAASVDQGANLFSAPHLPYPRSFGSPSTTSGSAHSDAASSAAHTCEYVVYLQQLPVSFVGTTGASSPSLPRADGRPMSAAETLGLIERELGLPDGAPIPRIPHLTLAALIFSPDCGFVLESPGPPPQTAGGTSESSNSNSGSNSRSSSDSSGSDSGSGSGSGSHLRGWPLAARKRRANQHTLAFAAICAAQLWALLRQMKAAATPSAVSRVSAYTIALMALGDGAASMALFVGAFDEVGFLAAVSTAFLAHMSVSYFSVRFLIDIWAVQAPERRQSRANRSAATRTGSSARGGGDGDGGGNDSGDDNGGGGNSSGVAVGASADASSSPLLHERQPATAAAAATAGAAPLLPPPITAPVARNATPTFVILPPDQDLDAAAAEDELFAAEAEAEVAAGTAVPHNLASAAAPATTGTALREAATLYTRFYLLLLVLVFLSLHVTSWPRPLRRAYAGALAFAYLSFWTPQIWRNARRNSGGGGSSSSGGGGSGIGSGDRHNRRRGGGALRREFVLAQSALRLVPVLYFYTVTDSVLLLRTVPDSDDGDFGGSGGGGGGSRVTMACWLAGWVWLQAGVLLGQDVLGPRFFVPARWLPPTYDYHPVLHEADLGRIHADDGGERSEGGRGSGSGAGGDGRPLSDKTPPSPPSSPASAARLPPITGLNRRSRRRAVFDCPICMQDIVVPIVFSPSSHPGNGASKYAASDDEAGSSSGGNSSSSGEALDDDDHGGHEEGGGSGGRSSNSNSNSNSSSSSSSSSASLMSRLLRRRGITGRMGTLLSRLASSVFSVLSFAFCVVIDRCWHRRRHRRLHRSGYRGHRTDGIDTQGGRRKEGAARKKRHGRAGKRGCLSYMVTPCRHIFHTECLEGWMDYRLQCPICRDNLVPL